MRNWDWPFTSKPEPPKLASLKNNAEWLTLWEKIKYKSFKLSDICCPDNSQSSVIKSIPITK